MRSSINTILTGNIFVSLVFSQSLSEIWLLVNTLQLIVNIPLLDITLPSNVMTFVSALQDTLSFNIIPVDQIHQKIYNLKDDYMYTAVNSNYQILGYNSSNFIYNMGAEYANFEMYLCICVLSFLLKPIKI
jgi:hypothetical protein